MAGTFTLRRNDGTGITFTPEHTFRAEVGEGQVMWMASGEPSMAEVRDLIQWVYDSYQVRMEHSIDPQVSLTVVYPVLGAFPLNPDAADGKPCKGGNVMLALKGKMSFLQLRTALDSLERKLEAIHK